MHIVPGFVVRQIAGETIAIPAGPAARELSGLLALNGSGKVLFDLLQTEQSEADLVQALLDNYEIDADTAQADVAEFLGILRSNGVLIESEAEV
ncbi:MAG: PqqD family protein [Oscillospiraceae bacterium]|nr:PqqD family protein [Oscillospiraceae bacterium]